MHTRDASCLFVAFDCIAMIMVVNCCRYCVHTLLQFVFIFSHVFFYRHSVVYYHVLHYFTVPSISEPLWQQ